MRYLSALIFLGIWIATSAEGQSVKLVRMTGNAIGKSTLITLDLSDTPQWQNVEMRTHDVYLEFKLPNTTTNNTGIFHDVESPYVLKLMPMQHSSGTLTLRMFVSERGHLVQRATTAEVAGQQVFITVDHRKLEGILSTYKVRNDNTHIDSGFAETIRYIGIVLITVTFMLIFLVIGSRWLSRVRPTNKKKEPTTPLKIISQLSLAAHQKLSIVEVYGQEMLFAVSASSLTLISKAKDTLQTSPVVQTTTTDNSPSNDTLNQNTLTAQKLMQKNQYIHSGVAEMSKQPMHSEAMHTTPVEEVANIMQRKLSKISPS